MGVWRGEFGNVGWVAVTNSEPDVEWIGTVQRHVVFPFARPKFRIRIRYQWMVHNLAAVVSQTEFLSEIRTLNGKDHPASLRPPNFLDVRHSKGGRSIAIRTGRLYPGRNPWYSFSGAESSPGHMVPSGGATEKIPGDTNGIVPGTARQVSQCLNNYATPGSRTLNISTYNFCDHHNRFCQNQITFTH